MISCVRNVCVVNDILVDWKIAISIVVDDVHGGRHRDERVTPLLINVHALLNGLHLSEFIENSDKIFVADEGSKRDPVRARRGVDFKHLLKNADEVRRIKLRSFSEALSYSFPVDNSSGEVVALRWAAQRRALEHDHAKRKHVPNERV